VFLRDQRQGGHRALYDHDQSSSSELDGKTFEVEYCDGSEAGGNFGIDDLRIGELRVEQ